MWQQPPPQSPTSSTSSRPPGTERISRSARQAALALHVRIQHGAFTAPALDATLAEFPDGRDRAFLTDLTYGSLRWQLWLQAALGPLLSAPDRLPPRVLSVLLLGSYEILQRGEPRFAVVNEWVTLTGRTDRRLKGLVNAVLRRVEAPAAPDAATAASLPGWLWETFRTSLGEHAVAAASGMLEPAPFWLAEIRPEVASALTDEGHTVRSGPVSGSLAVRLKGSLRQSSAWQQGLVQPMNPASLLTARLAAADGPDRVLDLASGNGSKAAVLAASGTDVTSVELQQRKIERAARNHRRLGVKVRHLQADLTTVPPGLEPFPAVLLDSPCTGSGTLRGNPEIKLRLAPADVSKAAELQRKLLATAARLTAPGGLLLHAVCSLTREEGPDNSERFLAEHPGFRAEPVAPAAARFLTPGGDS